MKSIIIHPHHLEGVVKVPTSKSLAHRAIIAASLSKGESVLTHVSMSLDIEATINAMRALGTTIVTQGSTLYINGNKTLTETNCLIDCHESGSTLRFMVPVSLINERKAAFTGRGKLGSRPLDVYYNIFDKQKINYTYKKDVLDLHIQGRLQSGDFSIPGDISSQFITGLLFALPLLEGDSTIHITSPLQSKGYIDLTLDMLKLYGITIENDDYETFTIKGHQAYKAHDYEVEGDFSQAANYLAAGALGNDVVISNLNLESAQGDQAAIKILESMGATLEETEKGVAMRPGRLQATNIDASQCPDIIPVMAAVCALSQGTSLIYNAKRLRIKECDRLHATCEVLKACGVMVAEKEDAMVITGCDFVSGAELSCFNDHRMAMMEAILATRAYGDFTLDDASCVAKSYPNFFEDYQMLGGQFDEC
jgi:3-phosphoshikimate 1-carboxyvinyltransferase